MKRANNIISILVVLSLATTFINPVSATFNGNTQDISGTVNTSSSLSTFNPIETSMSDTEIQPAPTSTQTPTPTPAPWYSSISTIDPILYYINIYDPSNQYPWAHEAIIALAQLGIIYNYPDGSFRPEISITRAEFVALLVRAYECIDDTAVCSLSDVPAEQWAYRYVASAEKEGFISGYEDGTFRPDLSITREEFLTILAKVIHVHDGYVILNKDDVQTTDLLGRFLDKDNVSEWAKGYVATVIKEDLVKGIPEGTGVIISPQQPITRIETIVFLYRAMVKSNLIPTSTPAPTGTPEATTTAPTNIQTPTPTTAPTGMQTPTPTVTQGPITTDIPSDSIVNAYLLVLDKLFQEIHPSKYLASESIGLNPADKAKLYRILDERYGITVLEMNYDELVEEGYIKPEPDPGDPWGFGFKGGAFLYFSSFYYESDTKIISSLIIQAGPLWGIGYDNMILEFTDGKWKITDNGDMVVS